MKDFLVKIDKENPLFEEFKKWFLREYNIEYLDFSLPYYGFIDGRHDFTSSIDEEQVLSLEEWYEEFIWQPKQGETIESSVGGRFFDKCKFICKYEDYYIVENPLGLVKVNYIKKYDPLSEDIEKLKKKAKDLGLKIDIIYEAI